MLWAPYWHPNISIFMWMLCSNDVFWGGQLAGQRSPERFSMVGYPDLDMGKTNVSPKAVSYRPVLEEVCEDQLGRRGVAAARHVSLSNTTMNILLFEIR
jgi:hypothetical protein